MHRACGKPRRIARGAHKGNGLMTHESRRKTGQAAGSAFGFATTYALGQVAKRYYASGRTLDAAQLKEAFSSMLQDARSLEGRYSGDIRERSRQVNVSELLPLVRQQ